MTNRKELIAAIEQTGFNGDKEAFAKLFEGNKYLTLAPALAAYARGVRSKLAA